MKTFTTLSFCIIFLALFSCSSLPVKEKEPVKQPSPIAKNYEEDEINEINLTNSITPDISKITLVNMAIANKSYKQAYSILLSMQKKNSLIYALLFNLTFLNKDADEMGKVVANWSLGYPQDKSMMNSMVFHYLTNLNVSDLIKKLSEIENTKNTTVDELYFLDKASLYLKNELPTAINNLLKDQKNISPRKRVWIITLATQLLKQYNQSQILVGEKRHQIIKIINISEKLIADKATGSFMQRAMFLQIISRFKKESEIFYIKEIKVAISSGATDLIKFEDIVNLNPNFYRLRLELATQKQLFLNIENKNLAKTEIEAILKNKNASNEAVLESLIPAFLAGIDLDIKAKLASVKPTTKKEIEKKLITEVQLLVAKNKSNKAIRILENFKNPSIEMQTELVKLYTQKGRNKDSIIFIKEIPADAQNIFAKPLLLQEAHLYEKSEEEVQKIALNIAELKNTKNKEIQNEIIAFDTTAKLISAVNHFHLKKYKKMEEILNKITNLKTLHIELQSAVYNTKGYLLLESDLDLKEAKINLDKAIALKPNSAAVIDSYGMLFYKMGNMKAAEKYLTVSYKMLQDSETATHLIKVLLKNKTNKAYSILKRLLKLNKKDWFLLKLMKEMKISTKDIIEHK